ncbi:MAG TPA: TPM domain-containing protein [Bacteroides sp.]|nr:TPM domain-containing protein [Bacteroides sp.]
MAINFFTKEEEEMIRSAILEAEKNTSGEIRVHVSNQCNDDAKDCAAWWFARLKMHKTKLRNGVLFYLAVKDRKFAILGDKGINAVTPDDFWDRIRDMVLEEFKKENFAGGLQQGILMAGEQLREHFPYEKGDVNELSNEISFGDKS